MNYPDYLFLTSSLERIQLASEHLWPQASLTTSMLTRQCTKTPSSSSWTSSITLTIFLVLDLDTRLVPGKEKERERYAIMR